MKYLEIFLIGNKMLLDETQIKEIVPHTNNLKKVIATNNQVFFISEVIWKELNLKTD